MSENGSQQPVSIVQVGNVPRTVRVGRQEWEEVIEGVSIRQKAIVIIDNTPVGEHVIRMTDEMARFVATKLLEVTSGIILPQTLGPDHPPVYE